jgi:spermidine synthase
LAALGVAALLLAGLRLWLAWRSRRWVVGERNGTTVVVRRRGKFLELVLVRDGRELVQSRQERGNELGSGRGYVDGLHVGMLLAPRPERVLFLGGGACIGPRQFEAAYPDASIDVVENDPLVIAAANRHFGFRITRRVAMHAADARKFVTQNTFGPYDLVVLDVYDALGIPAPLATPEFFTDIRHALGDNGALVVNLIRRPEVNEASLLAAITEAFPARAIAVFHVPAERGDAIENAIVLVAPLIPSDAELAERAADVTVAPFLGEIVRRRDRSPELPEQGERRG